MPRRSRSTDSQGFNKLGLSGCRRSMLKRSSSSLRSVLSLQEKETELNIFCNDDIVSDQFIYSGIKKVQCTPSIIRLEFEDLIEREDQTMFLEVSDILLGGHRKWEWVRFTDFLYNRDQYERYLDLQRELWRLIQDDVLKRKIPIQFRAVLQIPGGQSRAYLLSVLKSLQKGPKLDHIRFTGALCGIKQENVPKRLSDLFHADNLTEAIALELSYDASTSGPKSQDNIKMPPILDLCIDKLATGKTKKLTREIVQKPCMERGLKQCSNAAFGDDSEHSLIQSTSFEDPLDFSDVTSSTISSSSSSSCGSSAGDSERRKENQADPSMTGPICSEAAIDGRRGQTILSVNQIPIRGSLFAALA